MVARRKWTDKELIEAVFTSNTVSQVIFKIGLKANHGSSYAAVARSVERLKLDTSHFKGQGWAKGSSKTQEEFKDSVLPLLRKGVRVHGLRDKLLRACLKQACCEGCGITEWRGSVVPLQLDHIDGDRLNNEIENLRMLCANCHMQTDTWGFKNARRRPL